VVDRDVIEPSNLHRQILYDEEDAIQRLPKAEAAVRRLSQINSAAEVEGLVAHVNPWNIEKLLVDVEVVLDGTDNVETRYVVNDACVKSGKPWVYGGATGTTGLVLPIVPGQGPCLRCLFPDPPPPGSLPTCDTVGVLPTAPVTVAALQITAAVKMLLGDTEDAGKLTRLELWRGRFVTIETPRVDDCPACGAGKYEFLKRSGVAWVTCLCGRNSIQITPPKNNAAVDLEALAERLSRVGRADFNGLTLTAEVEDHEIVAFPDGRVIIKGTTDETVARKLYSRYLGS